MLPDHYLDWILSELREIKHVQVVRIGTRMPVVLPYRVTDDLVQMLKKHQPLWINTHFNHPRELTASSREALQRLADGGIPLGNQSVLLAGVNDCPRIMKSLVHKLVENRVRPYYLYQCMPVTRVRHHFQVPLKEGVDLVDAARQKMDGYAKRFKFIIGHDIGKLEICGRIDDKLIMKQLHARPGHQEESSRMLVRKLTDNGGWLDDLPEAAL